MAVDREVRYSVAAGVARIMINRPERRNALTWTAMAALSQHLAEARRDEQVRVVVLSGAGDAAFCSGIDLEVLASGASYASLVAAMFEQLWSLGKPVIAAVRGFAVAGGFGLALACDLVVCSDDSVFAAPEIDIGLWPFMITVPLVRSMPAKKALELMLTGRRVGAAEAQRIGFVNQVAAPADFDATVDELAAVLAAKSPAAMKLGRDSFYAVWDLAAAEALALLHPLLTEASGTDDARAAMAAFLGRRRSVVDAGAAAAAADQGDQGGGAEHLAHEHPEAVGLGHGPDQPGDDSADEGAPNADEGGHEEAHRVVPGYQEAAEGPDDEAGDQQGDDK